MIAAFELKILMIMAAFMILFVVMIIYPYPHPAFATHLYTGVKFFTNNPKYCISPSFTSSLNTAIRGAASDMNAVVSSFTLSNVAYNSNCFNKLYQTNFSPNYISISTLYKLGSPPHINHVYTAYNTHYTWTGASTCSNSFDGTIGPYNIRATSRHEFGHWIEMRHPSSSTDNTIMHFNFDCNYWNAYKTHDKSTIATVWPSTTAAITTGLEQQQMLDFALPNFDQNGMKKMTTLAVIGTIVKQSKGPTMDLGLIKVPQTSNIIKIEQVLKGNYKGDTVQVLTPASSSDKRIVVEDIYKPKGGDHALFLLFKSKGGFYEMVGLGDGKYQISSDEKMVRGKFAMKGMSLDNFRTEMLGLKPEPKQEEEKKDLGEQLGLLSPPYNKTQSEAREWQQLMRIVS